MLFPMDGHVSINTFLCLSKPILASLFTFEITNSNVFDFRMSDQSEIIYQAFISAKLGRKGNIRTMFG